MFCKLYMFFTSDNRTIGQNRCNPLKINENYGQNDFGQIGQVSDRVRTKQEVTYV